jgi:tRNA-splicing ligase RtcB
MGTATFHVSGRGCEAALKSCSHGAGRKLSRGAARAIISARQLSHQMGGIWYDCRRTEPLRDEAPAAYKDVRAVMRAQRSLVRIDRELTPLLVYKGS